MAESENETTLSPTDQSTAFSTTLDSSNSTKLDITREELEKRQLLHSQQLLKLELSQKSLVIDTLRNEQAAQLEEIREKLTDALHEKRLLQMRLKSTAQGYEHELRQAQRRRQEELASLHERQRQLEEANPLLSQGVDEIKQALHSPLLSEAEYTRLRTQDPEALPLRDYIMVHLHGNIVHLPVEHLLLYNPFPPPSCSLSLSPSPPPSCSPQISQQTPPHWGKNSLHGDGRFTY